MTNYLYYDYLTSKVCKVKENNRTYESVVNIKTYLDYQCIEHGSTLAGRKKAYQVKMRQKKFVPIFVNPHLVYFPNKSQKDSTCIWINYFEIDYVEYKKERCIIHFHDHTSLTCSHPMRIRHIILCIEQYLLMV